MKLYDQCKIYCGLLHIICILEYLKKKKHSTTQKPFPMYFKFQLIWIDLALIPQKQLA